jgi:hypothetical protein
MPVGGTGPGLDPRAGRCAMTPPPFDSDAAAPPMPLASTDRDTDLMRGHDPGRRRAQSCASAPSPEPSPRRQGRRTDKTGRELPAGFHPAARCFLRTRPACTHENPFGNVLDPSEIPPDRTFCASRDQPAKCSRPVSRLFQTGAASRRLSPCQGSSLHSPATRRAGRKLIYDSIRRASKTFG